jgi:DNA mismatch repair protein MutL
MPEIRRLPPSVVNKIAAGEVIERPASVVKELMENSVDAGATRIDVSIAGGGGEMVRVVDDGCGMGADQLPLAVAPHATSKLVEAEDLFQVATLGFRGEALASIAEVSQFLIRSRTDGAEAGMELDVNGGQAGEVSPCGCPVGTVTQVRNLFFNMPVRRKFLRTTQTELAHCSEAFTRIALAHEKIHFTLRHGERQLYDVPSTGHWRERIAAFFGDELSRGLIHVEGLDDPLSISGYVAHPDHSRANNRMQYLLLNGRHIRDRALQHALGEAYRGLLLSGRFPIAFLRIEMPPDLVDVNVHPTKLEVRFKDSGRVYSQLLGTLRSRFLTTDLTAQVPVEKETTFGGERSAPGEPPAAASAHDSRQADDVRRDWVNWAQGGGGQAPSPDKSTGGVAPFRPYEAGGGAPFRVPAATGELPFDESRATATSADWSLPSRENTSAPAEFPAQAAAGPGASSANQSALQVHNRYLITENDDGVVVIDQHALHERILYEQLKDKVLDGKLETQQLLVPEPIHLSPAEAAAALDAKDLLGELGIQVEPFGGDTVLVSSYPAMLANMNPEEILRQVIDRLLAGGKQPDRRDLLDELMHMIACKAAIKAGDRLAPEEVDALVRMRHLVQDAHHCPHGRPTALVFTREELDRRFKRT